MIPTKEVCNSERIAILSPVGVNLLMQRWTYHNTRVIIPTHTFDEQLIGPTLEAELANDWCEHFPGESSEYALGEFQRWLDATDDERGSSRRSRLPNRQAHSVIRREMRAYLRSR